MLPISSATKLKFLFHSLRLIFPLFANNVSQFWPSTLNFFIIFLWLCELKQCEIRCRARWWHCILQYKTVDMIIIIIFRCSGLFEYWIEINQDSSIISFAWKLQSVRAKQEWNKFPYFSYSIGSWKKYKHGVSWTSSECYWKLQGKYQS